MASTTALFTGLTGLAANARNLDVIGNNIANVNTTAYKSARLNFSTMVSRTISAGSPPGDTVGGTNPYQVGLGVRATGTQKNFSNGTISPTGDARDLAIDGDGFFVVQRGERTFYTRAGNFRPDQEQFLATPTGERLRGYGVDANYNITQGELGDVRIPLGALTIAEATRGVRFRGNLNAEGALPTTGARVRLGGTATQGLRAVAGANPPPTGTNLLEGSTRLVDVEDPLQGGSGTPLFAQGQAIELRLAEKGGKTLPTTSLEVSDSTTIDDLTVYLARVLGISADAGPNPDGAAPGVWLDPATGLVTIIGNSGVDNDLTIDPADLRLLDSDGMLLRQPFAVEKLNAADGESVRTTFVVYDSLGTPVAMDLTMSLEGRGSGGTSWRYTIEAPSPDGAGGPGITTGVLQFGTDGSLLTTAPVEVLVDRAGTGAETPLAIGLDFQAGDDVVTAFTDEQSSIAATFRDGSPVGTLSGFGIGLDGIITGAFSNGLTRPLGQIPIATFTNNEGLLEEGSNLFAVGMNSGTAIVGEPGAFGSGRMVSGSLELSNVELSDEFVKMILSSTGFSASSRVIRTTDELMQQLLVLGR